MNTQNKDKKTDSWPRWLARLVRPSWPRGRYNGRRVGGMVFKLEINLTWWTWAIVWKSYAKSIHAGPVHLWINTAYDHEA